MSEIDNKPQETPKNDRKAEKDGRRNREREFVQEFMDEGTRIGVRIQRTQAFRPFYSMCIGRFVQHDGGESFVPYIRVRGEVEHAKVKSIENHTKLIAGLVTQATEWIENQLQAREDEIIEKQQMREKQQMDREKVPTRPGLKQLSKIDRVSKSFG